VKAVVKAPAKVELSLHRAGFGAIAGVDEAGRGALAGPVAEVMTKCPP